MNIHLYCELGTHTDVVKVEAPTPEGWVGHYDSDLTVEREGGQLCPEHAPAAAWFSHNCPGCVAGFPDCGLGRSYQISRTANISETALAQIATGVCPFRVNGTFGFSPQSGFHDMDLREPEAPPEAVEGGAVIVDAIRVYIVTYRDNP